MPRLLPRHLLTVASLLVALILGVVIFVELPEIMRASTVARQAVAPPGPAHTSAPAGVPTHATAALPVPVKNFQVDVPPGLVEILVRPEEVTFGAGSVTWVAGLPVPAPQGGEAFVVQAVPVSGLPGGVQATADEQAQHLAMLRNLYGNIGTCRPPTTVSVGGIGGTLTGYSYRTRAGAQICDEYWVAANSSTSVVHSVESVALLSDYPEFEALAEQVRDSLTWRA